MVYKPKEIPENVNVTTVHPLVNFAYLLGTVVVFSGLVYLLLGAMAVRLATRMSNEREAQIGQQLLTTIPDLSTNSNLGQKQYLENLLNSLKTEELADYTPLTIHIQANEYPNAAIIPGGHIIVTSTFLEEAESENELAFVLAHEMGHHVARDPIKGLGRSLVFITVASALGMGTNNADIVTITGSLTNLHYSRQQETEADLYALSAVIDRYGHGAGSLDFFERITATHQDTRNKFSEYFSTHPLTSERIEVLNEFAADQGWSMMGEITELPKID